MRVLRRKLLLAVLSLGICAGATAQTSAKLAHKPPPWKEYCQGQDGFCFTYPTSWSLLGEVFNGKGVAVAPPQKVDPTLWDAVTVALVIPAPTGDEKPVTIDEAIAKATSGVRESGQDFETLQRQQRRVNDKPAELVKLHYVEKSTGREWIEELVFVEGPESEIYSVALKCAPSSLARMEPSFLRIVESWKLPDVGPASGATGAGEAAPKAAPAPHTEGAPPKAASQNP